MGTRKAGEFFLPICNKCDWTGGAKVTKREADKEYQKHTESRTHKNPNILSWW